MDMAEDALRDQEQEEFFDPDEDEGMAWNDPEDFIEPTLAARNRQNLNAERERIAISRGIATDRMDGWFEETDPGIWQWVDRIPNDWRRYIKEE